MSVSVNMEGILDQSPEGTTLEDIAVLYKKHEGKVVDILTELWQVQEVVQNKPYDDNREKWVEVRNICNAYEEEMENFMKSMKSK